MPTFAAGTRAMITGNGWRRTGLLAFAVAVIGAGGSLWYLQGAFARAEGFARHGLWSRARTELTRYLWLHPTDGPAHLLMAETWAHDEAKHGETALRQVQEHLAQIPTDSPVGPRARIQEARMRLFRLDQATAAEDALRIALSREPDNLEANYLLWKVFELTRRGGLAEPSFWKVLELTPATERADRLREWYLGQFFPRTANPNLDLLLGVIRPGQPQTARTESDRLVRFRRAEPHRALPHVAMARWFQEEGDPKFAWELLQQAHATKDQPDAFSVATTISVLIDLGETELAKEWWQRWPEPRDSYEYWLWTGILREQADFEYDGAVDAFRRALEHWPGPIDWRTRHRLVNCLRRSGKTAEADREQQAIKSIEDLSTDALHDQLRQAANTPRDPASTKLLADFYQRIGRPREAEGWRTVAHPLK